MKFLPTIEVQLLHEYYLDGRCTDFMIEPTSATQRILHNYRCRLKGSPNGFRLFAAATNGGHPLIPWQDDLLLIFHLRLRNPDFMLYTDLEAISDIADPIYTNSGLSPAHPIELAPRNRDIPSRPEPGVFADIELRGGIKRPDGGPKVFQVRFGAKRAHWSYYVITDMDAGPVHVEDRATPPVRFSHAHRTDLNAQPDHSDTIATILAEHYPQMQRLRFVSDDRIPCQEAVRKMIQLRSADNQLGGALPNPSFRNFTTTQVAENGTTRTQAAFFHITTYINRQSQTPGG